ncbi:MAG: glycerophosphodiester phosphodiesterase [Gammaproteobacteria bacterium]|nr:glycerophosphodiester phosphodiesterase [Gammaproteobacteria bacterium]NNM20473.1 glycerophosphodiester phosphodiesterase [Gammaproteobacteria bacterium]
MAHRGAAAAFPENTLAALRAAADCGVRSIEMDVQLTADRVPVLLHDESLLRTAGIDRLVTAAVASEVCKVPVGQMQQFGDRFTGETVPLLRDALEQLDTPGLRLFIELKRHSLRAFGRRRMLAAVLPLLAGARQECVLISFDRMVLEQARQMSDLPIGWVLQEVSRQTREQVASLRPEFVFCNHLRLAAEPGALWPGAWQWVIYEVTEAGHARQLGVRGATLIESMHACRLQHELHG